MAIALDSSNNAGESASVSSVTFSHTTGASLSNGIIVVSVNTRNAAGNANLDGIVSGVTYNGVALTRAQISEYTASTPVKGEIWYLVAPASGANNVVVTHIGTTSFSDCYAITYSGVDQTMPIVNSIGAQGSTVDDPTQSPHTIVDNAWTQDAIYHKINADMTIDANRTQEAQLSPNSSDRDAVGTYRGIATAGATAHTWTTTAGEDYAWVIAVLRPAGVYATDKSDIIAEAKGRASTGSVTVSLTIPTGFQNRILIVGTTAQDGNHSNYPVTSITYGGVALTKVRSDEPAGNVRTELWYLVAPAEGTANVVATFTGSIGEATAQCLVVSNVIQSASAIDANNGASGTSSGPSVTLTPNSNNVLAISVCSAEERFITYGTQADRNGKALGDQTFENAAMGSKYIATAAATALAYGILSSQAYAVSALSLAYLAPSATTSIKKVSSVAYASIKKISGVAIASVKKVAGLA